VPMHFGSPSPLVIYGMGSRERNRHTRHAGGCTIAPRREKASISPLQAHLPPPAESCADADRTCQRS
jgi:hypothetical protein